jgi:hypothetical protein
MTELISVDVAINEIQKLADKKQDELIAKLDDINTLLKRIDAMGEEAERIRETKMEYRTLIQTLLELKNEK